MPITNCLPPIVDSDVAVTSPLVIGVPVPAVSVELNVSVGPLVSPAVVEDATKRTSHNKFSENALIISRRNRQMSYCTHIKCSE